MIGDVVKVVGVVVFCTRFPLSVTVVVAIGGSVCEELTFNGPRVVVGVLNMTCAWVVVSTRSPFLLTSNRPARVYSVVPLSFRTKKPLPSMAASSGAFVALS